MHGKATAAELLRKKKVIFFDVGYTLAYPASGDWMFTKKFYELVGGRLDSHSPEEIQRARETGDAFLGKHHRVKDIDTEYEQFIHFYSIISEKLDLHLTKDEIRTIAYDRTYNMENYAAYPDGREVLEILSKSHRLGVISDTWPSIELQLSSMGLRDYFSFCTYSCFLGTFKPDKRMYLDALTKCGCSAKDTVFLDDSLRNLEGAAKLGITPVLVAANPASDVASPYLKIRSLSELIG